MREALLSHKNGTVPFCLPIIPLAAGAVNEERGRRHSRSCASIFRLKWGVVPENTFMSPWKSVLELDARRSLISGSDDALCDAIRRGADLRILTEFVYNEHLDPRSSNAELVREVSDFRVTYLVEDRWAAGIMSLRMPICPPEGFGPRASMSFFMYNQDGRQAIARPYLDGPPAAGRLGPSPLDDHSDMPKYHQHDNWDADTNAPSSNFVYDFERYRYLVCDNWEELYAHTADGRAAFGSLEALCKAFSAGREIKVGIRGCAPTWAKRRTRAAIRRVRANRPRLLLHRAKAVQRRLSAGGSRAAGDSPALYEPRLGLRLADAPQRRLGGPLALRSLYIAVPQERRPCAIRWFAR